MRERTRCRRLILDLRGSALALLILSQGVLLAADHGVRITFLPPPLEGTLSLGLYDKSGKLIRTLHREAPEKDFTVGLNGLITSWDGNDDAGQPVAAGKYSARGFAVGEVDVEGVAMHGNDWITSDESPRIRSVAAIYPRQNRLILVATVDDTGAPKAFDCAPDGRVGEEVPMNSIDDKAAREGVTPQPGTESRRTWMEVRDNTVLLADRSSRRTLPLLGLVKPIAACPGRNGAWVIDARGEGVVEVKEFSLEGEFQRRLAIDPMEPQPRDIIAVPGRDAFLLIEEKPGLQRVRGLALETPAEAAPAGATAVSTWKTFFSKSIRASDTFTAVTAHLGREKPFTPEEKIRLRLVPNELVKGETTEVDVQIATDEKGAFFRTPDGLPLRHITETPGLKWAVMGREGGTVITIFQSDGAVVEEFKARKLANMMAFDAGEYEWPAAPAAK